MAITIGLSKDELYDKFILFSRYGNFNDNTPNGNLSDTFDYYLKHYTYVYPDLFDDIRFNNLLIKFYDGQTYRSTMDYVEPIEILLKYGADINKSYSNEFEDDNYLSVFSQIVLRIIENLDNGDIEPDEYDKQVNEIIKLLNIFINYGINENLGYHDVIEMYEGDLGYIKFLELYNIAKNPKMLFHAKQRSSLAKVSLLPDNVLDSVFEYVDYDIPIGQTMYNNANVLSNLDTFSRFDPEETYPMYIHRKEEDIRDSLRDMSVRPSRNKFAKRTIKNRKKYKRKY